ncbi:MAG TPA: phage tail protein [Candidatus Acidoferrum sp.]|nr:phage tail protein [Candidatus Acidoferrum sp.]
MADDYQTGFYFSLSFQGLSGDADAAFKEVSGINKELKVEEVGCGGENRFRYRLPNGTSFSNLVLKRGVSTAKSALLRWCVQTLDNGLSVAVTTRNIRLNLLNAKGQTCSSWTFNDAYPVKWSASDLNSQDNSILIESLEFAYSYFNLAGAAGAAR